LKLLLGGALTVVDISTAVQVEVYLIAGELIVATN
jgi:hypothetical protein